MLLESVLNQNMKTFSKVFEDAMSNKVAQALDVLHITEGRKLLLGKVKENNVPEKRKNMGNK